MTSQRVERTWIRTGGYGRFRGEWVKLILRIFLNGLKIFNQTYENQIYKRETWSFIYIWVREKVIEKLGFNFQYHGRGSQRIQRRLSSLLADRDVSSGKVLGELETAVFAS